MAADGETADVGAAVDSLKASALPSTSTTLPLKFSKHFLRCWGFYVPLTLRSNLFSAGVRVNRGKGSERSTVCFKDPLVSESSEASFCKRRRSGGQPLRVLKTYVFSFLLSGFSYL